MTHVHVVTYATHAEGMYNDLVDDLKSNDLSLIVVGWNEQWRGYIEKLKAIEKAVAKLPPNDLVIVIDAFDTRMVRGVTADDILEVYKTEFGGNSVVFSKDAECPFPYAPKTIGRYVTRRVFGGTANAGMYFGRVKDVLKTIPIALEMTDVCGKDDQCAFNQLTGIKIDETNKVFKNLRYEERYKENHDTIFTGHPGMMSWSRLKRVPGDYLPFLWPELLAFIALVVFVIYKYRQGKK